MIRMYGFWRSAASFRVRIALNLKGLAYQETMIDLDAGDQHAPGYRAVNAQSVVPSLFVDDGPPLTQSLAILEYLEETHPQPALLPADARGRSRVRSLALLFAADHHPLIVPRVRRYLADALQIDEARRTGWLRHWFREGLVQAERRLSTESGTGRFCHGDTPGMADLCLISQVAGARGFQIDTAELPTVHRIAEACLALDAFARAHPLRQPGAPASHQAE
ncbi:maleylacetoacetate isomerase [Mycobacterium sp. KBS0706]|uniref:maleylacetoacetate isomerase n=1 Tax=Mycobacterium sp. KBS0706 TaxID=2578109 RepID=UPI001C8FA23E|nr:maleylacetoacetate isomerase [Mycobacterium sp. KBS0706]